MFIPLKQVDKPGSFDPTLLVIPRYAVEAVEMLVRIRDDVLKTVVFVGSSYRDQFSPVGTGFAVAHQVEDLVFPIIVTARHLIDSVAGDDIWVRYNGKEGVETKRRPKTHVWTSPRREEDLAAIHMENTFLGADKKMLPLNRTEWESALRNVLEPALADEVVTVGLYASHYGLLKNIPVVRVGHIAMLPSEPVMTDYGYVKAFLVETKSIAGLSGSPVYLNSPEIRLVNGEPQYRQDSFFPVPIGMMLGYHVAKTVQDQISVPQIQGEDRPKELSIDERNTGFAVVLPFSAILSLFESDLFQETTKKMVKEIRRRSGYRPAGIKPPSGPEAAVQAEPAADNPSHKEDFRALLNAAAAKKPPFERT